MLELLQGIAIIALAIGVFLNTLAIRNLQKRK